MRLIRTKLYYYRFKYDIFLEGYYTLKKNDEFKPGDEALKKESRLQVFCLSKYVVFCRIRGPPSFNLKKDFRLKGEKMNSLPKRRKYKDNPYTIKTIDNRYYILFKDGENIPRTVEVTKNIFDIFNQFELDDLKELNEYDRHIEHKELSEESMYNRGANSTEGLDDYII